MMVCALVIQYIANLERMEAKQKFAKECQEPRSTLFAVSTNGLG